MIVHLDASALVKRCVAEGGSRETRELSTKADVVATSLITRAEVAAALAKAVRLGIIEPDSVRKAQRAFASQWSDIAKVPITEALVSRAEALAWDIVPALTWQEAVSAEITLGTFDRPCCAMMSASGSLEGEVTDRDMLVAATVTKMTRDRVNY